ncbi:hypothetical protein AB5J72_26245 [Streptomyces sp. CG1]|uniref:hypothetical protein n=1 Tax=Streptomyces sp. CG1 TaxID=1287523 RepID=UPI0034E23402
MEGRILTAAVTIPTQFHGDLLATTKATYADGTNPRPGRLDPVPAVRVLVLPSSCAARELVPLPHSGVHRVGTNPPRTDAEPPEPCASTR